MFGVSFSNTSSSYNFKYFSCNPLSMVDVAEIGKKLALAGAAVVVLLSGCKQEPSAPLSSPAQKVVEQKYEVTYPELEAAVGFFKRGELDLAVARLEEAKKSLQALVEADSKYKKVLDGVNLLEEAVRLTKNAHDAMHEELKKVKTLKPEELASVASSWVKLPAVLTSLRACHERCLKYGNLPMARAVLGTYATVLRDWRVVVERAVGVLEGAGQNVSKLKQLVAELRLIESATDKELVKLK